MGGLNIVVWRYPSQFHHLQTSRCVAATSSKGDISLMAGWEMTRGVHYGHVFSGQCVWPNRGLEQFPGSGGWNFGSDAKHLLQSLMLGESLSSVHMKAGESHLSKFSTVVTYSVKI